jgi:hypothetical protein
MTQTSPNRIDTIDSWFRAHEDGDFGVLDSDHQSSRVGDSTNAKTIVYTTKHHCIPRIKDLSQLEPIAILGRGGLPLDEDLPFVLGSSQTRIFIGDADPPDLLIFAWLREHFPIGWHGVNDDFLVRHVTRDLARIRIRMSDAEREAVEFLPQLCPDFRGLLGEYCSSLLDDGFKIELEGATIDRHVEAHT